MTDHDKQKIGKSRWTQWVFKKFGHEAEKMLTPCMDPEVLGFIDEQQMRADAKILKKTGINIVLTEGLRRIILFEHEGRTGEIIAGLSKAVKACHNEGIKVIHHLTASFVGQNLDGYSERELEWLSIDAGTGQPAFLKIWGGWFLWCINNPDFRSEYFRLCKQVMEETGLDGFMVDEVYFRTGWHNCVCPHCRGKYRKTTGYDVPPVDDDKFWGNFNNPAFRAWLNFRNVSVGDFYQDLAKQLKEIHQNPIVMGCKTGEITPKSTQQYGDSNQERMRGVNTLFMEVCASSLLYSWRYLAANLAVSSGLSRYYATPTVSTMYSLSKERFFSWALRLSHGLRIWATASVDQGAVLGPGSQLLNFPVDREAFKQLFDWEKQHESELSGALESYAGIGLLLSVATRDILDHDDGLDYYAREFIGWSETLNDEHLQYEVIFDEELTLARLSEFALILLPNAAALSDNACRALVAYAKQGGGLIFTSETGYYDETGNDKTGESRLRELLDTSQISSTIPVPPKYGKLEQGNWIYFPSRPGIANYSTTNKRGGIRIRDVEDAIFLTDKECVQQRQQMLKALESVPGKALPIRIKHAQKGVLIKAFRKKDETAGLVHMLNCRGDNDIDFGKRIPEDYSLNFPRLKDDIILEFSGIIPENAYLISPDWDGRRKIKIYPGEAGINFLTVPAGWLKRYAVLCFSVIKT
jgi:Beta-galactosidase trimerisation domain